ncbi:MAG: InlB B-repeat-containing protein [Eubacteriales bacterium]
MTRKKKIIIGCVIGAIVLLVIGIWWWSQPSSYRLVKVVETSGTVELERDGISNIQVTSAMNLENNDRVSVGIDSYARLTLDQDKYVYAEASTEFELVAEGDSKTSKSLIKLNKGAITTEIQEPLQTNSTFEIETPNSVMAVRGTVYRVEALLDENGDTYTLVTVFEGEVETQLIAPDGTISDPVQVDAGKGVVVRGDEMISEYVVADLDENGNVISETVRSANPNEEVVVFDIDLSTLSIQTLESLQKIVDNGIKDVGYTLGELTETITEKKVLLEEQAVAEAEKQVVEESEAVETVTEEESVTVEEPSETSGVTVNEVVATTDTSTDTSTSTNTTTDTSTDTQENTDADVSTDTEENTDADVSTDTEENTDADVSTDTEENTDADVSTSTKYTVTFKNGNGTEDTVVEVEAGSAVSIPSDMSYDGYSFAGWYLSENYIYIVMDSVTPTEDMTLYAKWNELVTLQIDFYVGDTKDDTDTFNSFTYYKSATKSIVANAEINVANLASEIDGYEYWNYTLTHTTEPDASIVGTTSTGSYVGASGTSTLTLYYVKRIVIGTGSGDSGSTDSGSTDSGSADSGSADSGTSGTTYEDVIYYSSSDLTTAEILYTDTGAIVDPTIGTTTYTALSLDTIQGYATSWDTSERVLERWYGLTGLKYTQTGSEYNILDSGPYIMYPKWKTSEVTFVFVKDYLFHWYSTSVAECYVGDVLTAEDIKTLFPNITSGYSINTSRGAFSNSSNTIGPISESNTTYFIYLSSN